MEILIVGDTGGKSDEGMRKVSREIINEIEVDEDRIIHYASMRTILLHRNKYNNVTIVHFLVGPTYRTLLSGYFLKLFLARKPTTILSFIHPQWFLMANLLLRLIPPDVAITQTDEWKIKCSNFIPRIYEFPLAGVNPRKFQSVSSEKKYDIRRELNIPEDSKVILHVGHLTQKRNIEAFLRLKRNSRSYNIIVGSTATEHDPVLVDSLKSAGIHIIDEFVEYIEKYYQASDCYFFPTTSNVNCIQVPLSVIEAHSCGIPVVSTKFEGLPKFLNENESNITYVDNFEDINSKIEDAIITKEYSETITKRFTWAKLGDDIRFMYDSIHSENIKKGLLISLMGPDGCGKSSIGNSIIQEAVNRGMIFKKRHWRPGFFPYKYEVGTNIQNYRIGDNPQAKKSRGVILSTMILFYIYMDFAFGLYFLKRKFMDKGISIIYERFYYDIIVDPNRYAINSPRWLRILLGRMLPAPDIMIILDAHGDLIHERKQELKPDVINRLRHKYVETAGLFGEYLLVDVAENDIEACRSIIMNEIL